MAVTLYCKKFELDLIWSEFGVDSRLDGNNDGEEDVHAVNRVIEEASVRVNHFLLSRYTVAVLAASPFVRDATAYIAAHLTGKRRGLAPAEGFTQEYNWFIEQLKLIRDGAMQLTSETGLAAPRYDTHPVVTNHEIDLRFRHSKVRRVDVASSQVQRNDVTKQNDSLDYPGFGFSQ